MEEAQRFVYLCTEKVADYCEKGDFERAEHWLQKADRAQPPNDAFSSKARDIFEKYKAQADAAKAAPEMTAEQREICVAAERIAAASCHYAALGLTSATTCKYADLGLPPDVTEEKLKKAYHKLAAKFHPDKHSTDVRTRQTCETAFKRISEAHRELSDPDLRRRYDAKQARKRDRDGPQSSEPKKQSEAKKQKAGVAEWYYKFMSADRLPDISLTQSHIAAYCVRQIYRLATFMQGGGNGYYDWYGMLSRYAFDPASARTAALERLLWRFGGVEDYLAQLQDLQALFGATDYPRIWEHLGNLQTAILRYKLGNAAVEPTPLPTGASLEEACQTFVEDMRRFCAKMISMQDPNADWDELVKKFPLGRRGTATIDAVGVDFCTAALRDIMATAQSNLVKSIANRLLATLARVSKLRGQTRADEEREVALEKAKALREELSMEVGCEIVRNYAVVKKVARMLPTQITSRSKETCKDDIVRYFSMKFTELSHAVATWREMLKEAAKSCIALDNLKAALDTLDKEKTKNVWKEHLAAGDVEALTERYNALTSKFKEAVAHDAHLCDKVQQKYCELRFELLWHVQEARALAK